MEEKREKTGGREKGTPNKTQAQIRAYFQMIVEDNLEGLLADLKRLKPAERLKYTIELSKFVLPQLKSMELKNPEGEQFKVISINLGSGIKPPEYD
jgi:hypothetical protein